MDPYVAHLVRHSSWIGWFPILFYTTLWISEIYYRSLPPFPSTSTASRFVWPREVSSGEAYEAGALVGNTALLYSSIVAMAGFILLPFIVVGSSARDSGVGQEMSSAVKMLGGRWKIHISTLWTISQAVFALSMAATWFVHLKALPLFIDQWTPFRFTNAVGAASFIIATTGFSWSVSLWVPFALVSAPVPALVCPVSRIYSLAWRSYTFLG